ncbi:O-methyltransferase [Cystobacter fuscus]
MSISYPSGLRELLEELATFGERNDATTPERASRMLNITPETGVFLSVLVRSMSARNILEIGTSNGYSTVWLASAAAAVGGRVTTLDVDARKTQLAIHNLRRAGLQHVVEPLTGDAGAHLARGAAGSWDFVFLDADREPYATWWPDLWRGLKPNGLLVVDNAVSHAAEMEPLVERIRQEPGATQVLVPVGKGELMVLKATR